MRNFVEFVGRDSSFHELASVLEATRGKLAHLYHLLNFFFGLHGHRRQFITKSLILTSPMRFTLSRRLHRVFTVGAFGPSFAHLLFMPERFMLMSTVFSMVLRAAPDYGSERRPYVFS